MSLDADRARQRAGRRFFPAAAAVGVFAAVIALVPAWHVSLWYDETATISAAGRSVPDLWDLTRGTNAAQGVYYLLIHLWTTGAGTSPVAVRVPSAIAVGVAVTGVGALARRPLGSSTALLAAAVCALLPRITWSGIEARPYAMTAAVAVWLTVIAVRAVDRGWSSRGRTVAAWVGYAVLGAFGVALFVYLALLVVVHGALLLISRTTARTRWSWLAAAAGAAVLSAPVLLRSAGQTAQLGIDGKLSPGALVRSLAVTEWYLGDTPTPVSASLRAATHTPFTTVWSVAAVVLAVIGWSFAVVGLTARPRTGAVDLRWWLVGWIAVPAVLIGLYSVVVAPMYVPRYLTFAAPALAILIAQGVAVTAHRTRVGATVALALCVVLVTPVYVSQRTAFAKNNTDWSAVARYVAEHAEPGDGVYFAPRGSVPPRDPVTTTLRAVETGYPEAFSGLVDVTLETTPARAASLWGTSLRLADATDRLGAVHVVWVLRRRDEPSDDVAAEDGVLASAGFSGARVWRGPSDEIYRFARS